MASHPCWILIAQVFVLRFDTVEAGDARFGLVVLLHVLVHIRVEEGACSTEAVFR